jgi:hypothetical protein
MDKLELKFIKSKAILIEDYKLLPEATGRWTSYQ